MRVETLVESRPQVVNMTHEEARELQELGQRLASKKSWWGTDEPPEDTTVVRCVPHGRG